MAVPTSAEQAIYRGQAREWEVRVQMSLVDAPFTGTWSDSFSGTSLDTNKWLAYIPEGWGEVTVAGGSLLVTANTETDSDGDIVGQPYPPFVVSRHGSGVPFPTQYLAGHDFTHTFTVGFPSIAPYGVQYRVMASDQVICEVEANEALGLNVKMDEQVVIAWGMDTGMHTYSLSYDHGAMKYTLTRDGVFVADLTSMTVPLAIVIGNSAVDQGIVGLWTDIKVNSVSTTGVADSYADPTWVGYSPSPKFQEDGKWWAYMPYVMSGQVDVSRQNDVDTLRLTVQNLQDEFFPYGAGSVYKDAEFHGREIKVHSRIGDTAGNWTNWRTIFYGVIDEPSGKADSGVAEFDLQARDRWRRELFETRIIKSWGDYDTTVKGIVNNKTVEQIIDDLMTEALVPSGKWVFDGASGTRSLVPRTFNVMDQSCGSAIVELLEGMAYSWYVDHTTGIIHFEEWPQTPDVLVWPPSGDVYSIDGSHEVERVDWSEDAFSVVAQAVVGIQNTEQQVDIKLGWPPSPIPAGGRRDIFFSKVGQTWDDLENNNIPKKRWYMLNRNVGSVEAVATAQDWMHHGYEYINLAEYYFLDNMPLVWFLDGWSINFAGDDYQTTLHLVTPNMSGVTAIIRDGMLGG